MMTPHLLPAWGLLGAAAALSATTSAAPPPTTIMAVGDSITFGCGYNAKPPAYGLECDGGDSSYRAKLYALLTAAGHSVQFVGRAKSGSAPFPADQWAHEGYSGQRIDQLDAKLFGPSPWSAAPPDLMLVMLGTNDIWHQNATTSTMAARMTSFLNHTFAKMPQTKVFLASITNMAGRTNLTDCDPIGTRNCPGHDGNPQGHSCCCGCRTYWPPMVTALNAMLAQQVNTHKAAGKDISFVDLFTESKVCSSAADADDCCHSNHVHPTKKGYESMAAVWSKHILPRLKSTDEQATAKPQRDAGILYEIWHAAPAHLMKRVKASGATQPLTVESVIRSQGKHTLGEVFGGPTPEVPKGFNPDIYNVQPQLGFCERHARLALALCILRLPLLCTWSDSLSPVGLAVRSRQTACTVSPCLSIPPLL